MTPKAPRVTAADVIRALERAGFRLSRQSGSHKIFKNAEGRRVTVPFHGVQTLHPKLLKSILLDAGFNAEELARLLHEQ